MKKKLYPNPIKNKLQRRFCKILNRIDFRYWKCEVCGYDPDYGKIIEEGCPKHCPFSDPKEYENT